MLETIRKYASTTMFKILSCVLAATFLFYFGISDIIRRWTGKDYVVKVGSVKITPVLFSMEKAKKLNMLRSTMKNIDEKKVNVEILHQIIWENVIDQASNEFGFIVSEETIKKYIAGMGLFRDKDGGFNAGMLRRFLQGINISEPMFIEFSGKDIKNALIKAPFKYVSVYKSLNYYMKANLEKRIISVTEIKPGSVDISEKPLQNELEDFYAENQNLFTVDETRDFSVVLFYEDDIAKNITVSEEEVRDYYETSPEREDRTFDEMKDEIIAEIKQNKLQGEIDDKTRQIEDALMAGENIDDVVKKFGLHVMKVKGATAFEKGKNNLKYYEDVLTVAFSTEEGSDSSFTEAVDEKDKRLLWLLHVDSITPKHVANFADVRAKVEKEWKKKKQHDKAIELAQSFCDKVNSGERFSEVLRENGKKSFVVGPFDRNGEIEKPKDNAKRDEKDAKNKKDQKDKVKKPEKTKEDEKKEEIALKLAKQTFKKNEKGAFFEELNGTIVIAHVDKIVPMKDSDFETNQRYRLSLIREISDDLYQQLVGYLSREKYEIKINNEMLEKTGTDSSRIDDIF